MVTYRILAWRSIPTAVEVRAEDGTKAKREMPRWFSHEAGRIAMREGLTGTDAYLAAFAWTQPEACDGTLEEVLEAVVAEQAARFGRKPDGHPIEGAKRYTGDGR